MIFRLNDYGVYQERMMEREGREEERESDFWPAFPRYGYSILVARSTWVDLSLVHNNYYEARVSVAS